MAKVVQGKVVERLAGDQRTNEKCHHHGECEINDYARFLNEIVQCSIDELLRTICTEPSYALRTEGARRRDGFVGQCWASAYCVGQKLVKVNLEDPE